MVHIVDSTGITWLTQVKVNQCIYVYIFMHLHLYPMHIYIAARHPYTLRSQIGLRTGNIYIGFVVEYRNTYTHVGKWMMGRWNKTHHLNTSYREVLG